GFSRTSTDRPVYAETNYPRQAFGWSPLASWRSDRFLLVRAPKPELYDVVSDPGEVRNLVDSRARVVDGMSKELEEFVRSGGSSESGASSGSQRSQRAVDPAVAARRAVTLQPGQMLAQYELGVALYETGDLQTAARQFEAVAARMPKFADARYSLGSVYARIDRVPDALDELKAALALEPRHFRANL